MRLVLLGPPGSGKGTQAKLLSDRLGLLHIGTGDILREAVCMGTPTGLQAEPYVSSGKLVPDSLVNDLIADVFRRDGRPEHFVMDGYPRTLTQAVAFDQVLRQANLNLGAVCLLVVDDEEIVRRLSGRWTCPQCHTTYHLVKKPAQVPGICDHDQLPLMQREDDKADTIRRRLRTYHHNTRDVIQHYRNQGLLHEVPGEGNIESIYSSLVEILKQAGGPC